jgi:transposase
MFVENLNFRHFFESTNPSLTDYDVFAQYLHHPEKSIKAIAQESGKSIGEIYRIIRRMGCKPNRNKKNPHLVKSFLNSGLSSKEIAQFTGYSRKQVENIRRKNGNYSK